ncbi:MAG: hypothetical protein ACKVII_22905, partial [Planctomycetales bacterium]
MTTNQNSSNDPDSWEGLAKDLFGIDVGKKDADDEPFEVIDLSSLEPEAEPVEEEPVEIEVAAEDVDSDVEDDEDSDIVFEDDDDDDFDIIFDEDDEEEEEVAAEPEPAPAPTRSRQPEPVAEAAEPRPARKSVPKSDADDSFWDPLDDWDIGGKSHKKSTARSTEESPKPVKPARVEADDEGDSSEDVAPVAKKESASPVAKKEVA